MAKPRKVEEPAGIYQTTPKKTAKGETAASASVPVRRADDAAFRKAADKVLKTHSELFRRLAQ